MVPSPYAVKCWHTHLINVFIDQKNWYSHVAIFKLEQEHQCATQIVTQRQLMRLFAVKLILSYEQKCKLRSKFLKN